MKNNVTRKMDWIKFAKLPAISPDKYNIWADVPAYMATQKQVEKLGLVIPGEMDAVCAYSKLYDFRCLNNVPRMRRFKDWSDTDRQYLLEALKIKWPPAKYPSSRAIAGCMRGGFEVDIPLHATVLTHNAIVCFDREVKSKLSALAVGKTVTLPSKASTYIYVAEDLTTAQTELIISGVDVIDGVKQTTNPVKHGIGRFIK